MNCPDCGRKTKVAETRSPRPNVYRRRYVCACGIRFSSVERVEKLLPGYAGKKIYDQEAV